MAFPFLERMPHSKNSVPVLLRSLVQCGQSGGEKLILFKKNKVTAAGLQMQPHSEPPHGLAPQGEPPQDKPPHGQLPTANLPTNLPTARLPQRLLPLSGSALHSQSLS